MWKVFQIYFELGNELINTELYCQKSNSLFYSSGGEKRQTTPAPPAN